MATPARQQHCVGLLIVEARKQAAPEGAPEAWRRYATCYGVGEGAASTGGGAVGGAGGVGSVGGAAAAGGADGPSIDLLAHHLQSRKDARPDDIAVMSACLGKAVYEVEPVFRDDDAAAQEEEGGGGGRGLLPRRRFAPPPACTGVELMRVLRESAAAAAAGAGAGAAAATAAASATSEEKKAVARRRPAASAAAASAASTASSAAARPSREAELSAFAVRFRERGQKNLAAMRKLLSDIGAGLLRPPSSSSRDD